MLVLTIIFDVYDAYGAEVSDHMSLPYSFSFKCKYGVYVFVYVCVCVCAISAI